MELLFVVGTTRLLVAAPPFLNKQPVASHYAAWPARHRESNHFIKMIGLVREISSQKIRRQLAWTYSDPTLQVWNLAQTKSYLVKLAKVNSTKKHKAARCSHFSWKCNIRCWCVYAHISVHNPAFFSTSLYTPLAISVNVSNTYQHGETHYSGKLTNTWILVSTSNPACKRQRL